MIPVLISIIVTLIVVGLLWWAAQKILAVIPLAEPFKTVVYVLLVVVLCLIVLYYVILPLIGAAGVVHY